MSTIVEISAAVILPYGTRPVVITYILLGVVALIIVNILRLVASSEQRHRKTFKNDLLGSIAVAAILLGLSLFILFADRNPNHPANTIGMFILFIALVAPVTVMKVNRWRKQKKKT